MKLFSRPPVAALPQEWFGAWLLRQFARDEPTAAMTFQRLEEITSRAASLLCAAIYARPDEFVARVTPTSDHAGDAAVIARRTADGFQAALADRNNVVLAWPWDHLATRIVWVGNRDGVCDERSLGAHMEGVAVAYSQRYRAQLRPVFVLWDEVAATTARPDVAAAGGLEALGLRMWEAFHAMEATLTAVGAPTRR